MDDEKWENVYMTANPAIGLVTSIGVHGNIATIEESFNYVRANAEKKWKTRIQHINVKPKKEEIII